MVRWDRICCATDIFSTVIGYSDGTKGKFGNLIFDYQCFVLPLTQGQPRLAPIPFVADITHGIDGSGAMRQIFKKSLFSEPAGLTIIFRESGTKLPDVPVDVSKDKAFEAYDAAGKRISTFGGYGVLEGNYISDFDVHPTKPWAVTTATRVTLDDVRTVGIRSGILRQARRCNASRPPPASTNPSYRETGH